MARLATGTIQAVAVFVAWYSITAALAAALEASPDLLRYPVVIALLGPYLAAGGRGLAAGAGRPIERLARVPLWVLLVPFMVLPWVLVRTAATLPAVRARVAPIFPRSWSGAAADEVTRRQWRELAGAAPMILLGLLAFAARNCSG